MKNSKLAVEAICALNNTQPFLMKEEVPNGPVLYRIEIPMCRGLKLPFMTKLVRTISFSTENETFDAALTSLQEFDSQLKKLKTLLQKKPSLKQKSQCFDIDHFLANFICPLSRIPEKFFQEIIYELKAKPDIWLAKFVISGKDEELFALANE